MTSVVFGAIGVFKEVAIGMIPENFKKALNFAWAALTGTSNWVGYILAALFYVGEEYGFENDVCETLGYGYLVIDELAVIVNFMPVGDTSGINIANLASLGAKENAAEDAYA